MPLAARLVVFAVLGLAWPRGVLAQHSHHEHGTPVPSSAFGASLSVLAAHYDTPSFTGNYQGLAGALRWSADRYAAFVSLPLYRLEKNGARQVGIGDLVAHAQAMVIGDHPRHLGVALAVSAPTGSQRAGLGMGHVMLMPALWGTWAFGDLAAHASVGYGRALGASSDGGHTHGSAPLVDPMNFSELTYSASADVGLARELRIGARLGGGVPLDDAGVHRLIGALRVLWTAGRVVTTAEVQAGLAGDPFTLRGVVETAIRF